MHCSWCHGVILEDARTVGNNSSAHYWCLDFFESGLTLMPDVARRSKVGQFLSRSLRRFSGNGH
jgi:hypothetical protein